MGHKKIFKSYFEILAPTKREKVARLATTPVQAPEGREAFATPGLCRGKVVAATMTSTATNPIPQHREQE